MPEPRRPPASARLLGPAHGREEPLPLQVGARAPAQPDLRPPRLRAGARSAAAFPGTLNHAQARSDQEFLRAHPDHRWIAAFQALLAIRDVAARSGARLFVFISPDEIQLFTPRYDLINERFARFCAARGLDCWDPLPHSGPRRTATSFMTACTTPREGMPGWRTFCTPPWPSAASSLRRRAGGSHEPPRRLSRELLAMALAAIALRIALCAAVTATTGTGLSDYAAAADGYQYIAYSRAWLGDMAEMDANPYYRRLFPGYPGSSPSSLFWGSRCPWRPSSPPGWPAAPWPPSAQWSSRPPDRLGRGDPHPLLHLQRIADLYRGDVPALLPPGPSSGRPGPRRGRGARVRPRRALPAGRGSSRCSARLPRRRWRDAGAGPRR